MTPELNHIFAEHWKFLLMLGFFICAVQTMPTPGKDGAPSHWLYRWLFGFLHLVTFQWMRLAVMLYPQVEIVRKLFNGVKNGSKKNGENSNA